MLVLNPALDVIRVDHLFPSPLLEVGRHRSGEFRFDPWRLCPEVRSHHEPRSP